MLVVGSEVPVRENKSVIENCVSSSLCYTRKNVAKLSTNAYFHGRGSNFIIGLI